MEENREPLSAIAIEKKLQLLRNKHFSEDTIALVKSDYEYGLTEEEISLYLNKSYDIEQMKILSECLHKDVPKDVIDIIKNTKYSVHQLFNKMKDWIKEHNYAVDGPFLEFLLIDIHETKKVEEYITSIHIKVKPR